MTKHFFHRASKKLIFLFLFFVPIFDMTTELPSPHESAPPLATKLNECIELLKQLVSKTLSQGEIDLITPKLDELINIAEPIVKKSNTEHQDSATTPADVSTTGGRKSKHGKHRRRHSAKSLKQHRRR